MNILFYYAMTYSPLNGGIANVSLWLANYFVEMGHNVILLSRKPTTKAVSPLQRYLPNANEQYASENRVAFIEMTKSQQTDVVINQNGITPEETNVLRWCDELHIPCCTVLHNSLYGIYNFNDRLGPLIGTFVKWFHLRNIANKITHFAFRKKYGRLYRLQCEKSTKVVLLSNRFRDEYRWFSGCKDEGKMIAIPNCLTIPVPQMVDINVKRKELLFVGRLAKEKRLDLLIDIWEKLFRVFSDWQLTIVGTCNKQFEKRVLRLKEKIRKRNIERVVFEGFQNPAEYYKRASLFCMTSEYEGLGLVLIEAMAYGTVPVAFDSYANVSEIITHGKNGMLVPPFRVREYSKTLASLMNDPKRREAMAFSAINTSHNYDVDAICKKWLDLFDSLSAR